MLIPMVESHCSCCLGPAGASQKEPHSRVQAMQCYLQSMEESWKNVFLIKKKGFVFFFHPNDQNQISLVLFPATLHVKLRKTAVIQRGLRNARKSLRSWQSMARWDAARHWSATSSGPRASCLPVTQCSTLNGNSPLPGSGIPCYCPRPLKCPGV